MIQSLRSMCSVISMLCFANLSYRSNGAADLRSMSHSAFLDLARSMYRGYLNCIEGLHRQGAIVIDVVQSIQYVRWAHSCEFPSGLT